MKKHLTDGLLDIALLLSLLRTDLHNLLNADHEVLFNNYPEIQEIFLGSTSAYTQTHNFHANNWHNSMGAFVHPKSIDNFYANSIFRDLHELSHYRRFDGIQTNINAYLASSPGTGQLASETASTSQGGNDPVSDSNNNEPGVHHPTGSATEHSLPPIGSEPETSGESELSPVFVGGGELTKEVTLF